MEKTAEEILEDYETVSIMTDYDQYEPHWGKDSVLQAMEAYASQFKQPVPDEVMKEAILFHLWMKVADTPQRAAEWFHYSDEDMYREFKTPTHPTE